MRASAILCLPIIVCCSWAVHSGEKKEKFPDPTPRKEAILKGCVEEFRLLVPDGDATFVMGSDKGGADNERPAHKVTLKYVFAIGKYEVTQELYSVVMGKNPAKWQGVRNSVEMVTWDDAMTFCARLTKELRKRKLIGDGETIRLPSAGAPL